MPALLYWVSARMPPHPEPVPTVTGAARLATLLADGPAVMGILNVTPDSFSDGGRHVDLDRALDRAREMVAEGAAIIDVGGESTRPGADPVPLQAEIARVVPVIEAIRAELDVLISVDTLKPEVMRAACAAGAEMINDVNALRSPDAIEAASVARVGVCLMHMQGEPRSMQQAPHYTDVVAEVSAFLADRVAACRAAGIPEASILVDPGIGFGKRLEHNLALLANMHAYASLGAGALIGVSRKSMFGQLLGVPVEDRLPAGLAVAALSIWQGARVIRVHDVAATIQAVRTAEAIKQHRRSGD
jgi:dihydropteroate synthase